MIPKIKAQKTRLSNYLIKELGAKLYKSKSTESEYLIFKDFRIRISDHIGKYNKNVVNILIPFDDSNSFIIEHNSVITILHSLKEVKIFLHSILFTPYKDHFEEQKRINETIELLVNKNTELTEKIEDLNTKINEYNERIESLISKNIHIIEKIETSERLGNVTIGNIVKDTIIINSRAYNLKDFPDSLRTKINNIISNSKTIKPSWN